MIAKNECHHGSLRRSCDCCDMGQDIEALQRELAAAHNRIDELVRVIRASARASYTTYCYETIDPTCPELPANTHKPE